MDRDPGACPAWPRLPIPSQPLPNPPLKHRGVREGVFQALPSAQPSSLDTGRSRRKLPNFRTQPLIARRVGLRPSSGDGAAPGHRVRFKLMMVSILQTVSARGPGLRTKQQVKALEFQSDAVWGQSRAMCCWLLAPQGQGKPLPVKSDPNPIPLGEQGRLSTVPRLPLEDRLAAGGSKVQEERKAPPQGPSLRVWMGALLSSRKETHSVRLPSHLFVQEQAWLFSTIMCHAWLWPPAPESSVTHWPLPWVPRGLGRVDLAWGWYKTCPVSLKWACPCPPCTETDSQTPHKEPRTACTGPLPPSHAHAHSCTRARTHTPLQCLPTHTCAE